MDQDTSNTPEISAEPPFGLDPVAIFLKENCRKEEEAIQAIEDSAYVTRRGRRELQDPKRLALAVELRGKHMGNFYAFSPLFRETEAIKAYTGDILQMLFDETADSPEICRRVAERLGEIVVKYEPRTSK